MKVHTSEFKQELIKVGKQIDSIVTYTNNNDEEIILHDELYSITPMFESNLLKSVMKQLDIESSVDIPLETILNYKLGVLIDGSYEYLDYGNFVVYKSEKLEDKNHYKITCYDKMIYSMKDYEEILGTYPMTIKNYLNLLATQIGLSLKDANFYNYNQTIPFDLYKDLGYTYRDVLDEIAEATGSIIIINNADEIEVKYLNYTNDTIDEEYLKDINVKFGKKYGPVNSIVLSRSAESDNVYLRDETSVEQNGLCEIKIIDNQIMNFNDRSEFLQGILTALNGVEYYINDFNSIGVLYYDVGDFYNIEINNDTYQCLMLNDEINVTSGLEEIIHTEMPEQSETDYTKSDKTDMKINQTYLIVDKQNQTIESVVTNVNTQNNKISQITQTVDELNQKIQDIADITIAGETTQAYLELSGINESEPISINIHPVGVNISYLYPRSNLYPSDTLYMTNRKLRFIRHYEEEGETLTQNIDYTIPDDLLYYDSNNYDEFILNYDSQTCQVRKKCKYNADGTVSLLPTEVVTDYSYPQIFLENGDYEIELLGYNIGYLSVRLMAQNIYTSQFATKVEMNSAITQTAEEINLEVSKKVGNNEIISKINQSAEAVTINANKIGLQANDVLNILSGNTINLTSKNLNISSNNFNVDKNGNVTCTNADVSGSITSSNVNITGGNISLNTQGGLDVMRVIRNNDTRTMAYMSDVSIGINNNNSTCTMYADNNYASVNVSANGSSSSMSNLNVITPELIQTSLAEQKKNFEKLQYGLNIIKNVDIYKYNLKTQKDTDKKHIGFVIGKDFKYSNEITAVDINGKEVGVDTYSMISVSYKAIQELLEMIEQLQKEIQELRKGE